MILIGPSQRILMMLCEEKSFGACRYFYNAARGSSKQKHSRASVFYVFTTLEAQKLIIPFNKIA